jgi:hypothetical protein
LLGVSVANVVFATAILKNKRWGFWGFVAASVGIFALNLMLGVSVVLAAVGLLGVVLLFGLLQLGNPGAWSTLR